MIELDPACITTERWLLSESEFRSTFYRTCVEKIRMNADGEFNEHYQLTSSLGFQSIMNLKSKMSFVFIPGTDFSYMGCPLKTKPVLMGVSPVTQMQWRLVMNETYIDYLTRGLDFYSRMSSEEQHLWLEGSGQIGPEMVNDDFPMVYIWADRGNEFLEKIGSRFPTVSEWLAACQFEEGAIVSLSQSIVDSYGWTPRNSGESLHSVMTRRPNKFGLFDMIGNAEELVRNDIAPIRDDHQDGMPFYAMGGSVVFDVLEDGLGRLDVPMFINKCQYHIGMRAVIDLV